MEDDVDRRAISKPLRNEVYLLPLLHPAAASIANWLPRVNSRANDVQPRVFASRACSLAFWATP